MKKKSFPFTSIFVAFVVAFAAWTYFAEYKGNENKEKAKAESAALLPFSNADVVRIHIKKPLEPAPFNETLVRKTEGAADGGWQMDSPFTDLVDPMSVTTFLATISTEKATETVVEAPDIAWATFGLDKPLIEAEITAKTATGEKTRKITIGSKPAYDGSVYGRYDSENKVQLFSSTVEAGLKKEARDFRDKRVFPGTKHPEFSQVQIVSGSRRTVITKMGEDWKLAGDSTPTWPLDPKLVSNYIAMVSGLRANDIWAEDKAEKTSLRVRKLDRPATTVTLSNEKGEKYEVSVAPLAKEETVGGMIGSARPHIFSVTRAQIDALSVPIHELRDHSYPFRFKIADVGRIEITRPKPLEKLPTIVKVDGKWSIEEKEKAAFSTREIKPEAVDEFLIALDKLEAIKISTEPRPKVVSSGFEVKLKATDGKLVSEIVINSTAAFVKGWSSKTLGMVHMMDRAAADRVSVDFLTPKKGKP